MSTSTPTRRWWVLGILVLIVAAIFAAGGCGTPAGTSSRAGPGTVATQSATPKLPPGATVSQLNAVTAASDYLRSMPFSRDGLAEQLVYEGYSTSDAAWALNFIDSIINWNEEAALKARSYLASGMSFSHSGLVDQLQYDGFTAREAEYGTSHAGL